MSGSPTDETKFDPHAGIFARAWKDYRAATQHWRFSVPVAVVAVGCATWAALLPAKADAAPRIVLAVVPLVGIASIVFAYMLIRAPVRQRDEARERLRPANPIDVRDFSFEFSAFILESSAAFPGFDLFVGMGGMASADRARLEGERNAEARRVERNAVVRYHREFRKTALAILDRPRYEDVRDEYGAIAENPPAFADLRSLDVLFKQLAADRIYAPIGGTASEYREAATQAKRLAEQVAAFLDAEAVKRGMDASDALGASAETLTGYFERFRPAAVEVFDDAERWGVIAPLHRAQLERPDLAELDQIPGMLRTIAERLMDHEP